MRRSWLIGKLKHRAALVTALMTGCGSSGVDPGPDLPISSGGGANTPAAGAESVNGAAPLGFEAAPQPPVDAPVIALPNPSETEPAAAPVVPNVPDPASTAEPASPLSPAPVAPAPPEPEPTDLPGNPTPMVSPPEPAPVTPAAPVPMAPVPEPQAPVPLVWEPREGMAVPRSELSAAAMDGRFYLAGGFGNQTRFDAYDVATDEWLALADLPGQRHHASIAARDGYVYVFGGNRQTNSWRYSVATNTWEVREPLPLGRHSAVAVPLGEYIYLVGGAGASAEVLLRLDPTTDTWEQLAPLGTLRDHPAAVALGGKIYCIGGRAGAGLFHASMEIYDPEQGSWSPGPEMGTPRSGAPAVVIRDQIAIFGGEISLAGRSVALDTSETFSARSNTWQPWPQLPFGVHGVAAAVHDGRLFLMGGSTQPFGIVTVQDVHELTFQ